MQNTQHQILNAAALLFLGLTLFVMLVQYLIGPSYKVNRDEMVIYATENTRWILPHQLHQMMTDAQLDDYLLVDLRSREEFQRGSLPGAINIPMDQLLENPSRKALSEGGKLLLFSGEESEASIASLLLLGAGFSNIHVLANDYMFTKTQVMDDYHPAAAFTHQEKAWYDFARFFKAKPESETKPLKSQPEIIETEVISVQGGC
jgi:rhodanese-related sulfurtransferase